MTITIDIETILYGGTAIMLTMSITIVLMVYFFHRNLMHYQDDTFFKTMTTGKKVKKKNCR